MGRSDSRTGSSPAPLSSVAVSDRIANEPVERPIAVVITEVALTAGVAYLAGLCLAIAAANADAPAVQLVIVLIGIGLVLSYGAWLLGGSGVPLAAFSLPLLILAIDASLIASGIFELGVRRTGLFGPGLGGILPPLLAVAAAGTGLICGLVLPGPRRLRSAHGRRRRAPVTASAELSQGAVMERLRSAPSVTAAPTNEQGVWFDDATEDDRLLPLESLPDPNPDPDPDWSPAANHAEPAHPEQTTP